MENKNKFNPLYPHHSEEYEQIKDLTGRQIVAYIKDKTGIDIDVPLKNKKKIIRVAIAILKRNKKLNSNPASQTIHIGGWSKHRFIDYAYDNWKVDLESGLRIITLFTPTSVIRKRFIHHAGERGIRIEQ